VRVKILSLSPPLHPLPPEAGKPAGGGQARQGRGIESVPFIPALPGGAFWRFFVII